MAKPSKRPPAPQSIAGPAGLRSPTLRIIATGGTFDKHYDSLAGTLTFAGSHLPGLLERARLAQPAVLEVLMLLDSLDMHDADRERIVEACRVAPEDCLVVIHGTDTMRETAHALGKRFDSVTPRTKTIVLTGSMIPSTVENSDAQFNLGFACACAAILPPEVYIAMNGRAFRWDKAFKNRDKGVFEAIESVDIA